MTKKYSVMVNRQPDEKYKTYVYDDENTLGNPLVVTESYGINQVHKFIRSQIVLLDMAASDYELMYEVQTSLIGLDGVGVRRTYKDSSGDSYSIYWMHNVPREKIWRPGDAW